MHIHPPSTQESLFAAPHNVNPLTEATPGPYPTTTSTRRNRTHAVERIVSMHLPNCCRLAKSRLEFPFTL